MFIDIHYYFQLIDLVTFVSIGSSDIHFITFRSSGECAFKFPTMIFFHQHVILFYFVLLQQNHINISIQFYYFVYQFYFGLNFDTNLIIF